MKNHFRIFAFVVACLGFMLTGCEKENLEPAPIQNKYTIKQFKFSDLKNKSSQSNIDAIISQGIGILKDKEPKNRGGDNSFIIDSTTIKEITFGNYRTYTMFVKRAEQTKDYFENIIVEIDSLNKRAVYITKYFPDQKINYLPEHDTHTFHGETQTYKAEFPTTLFGNTNDFDPNQPVGDSGAWLNCVWILKCDWHGTHNAGPGCNVTYLVRVCTTQNGTPVSSSPVFAPSWGPSGINSSNSGSSGTNVNNPNNTTNPTPPTPTPPITSIVTPPVTDSELNAENIIANEFYYPLSKEKKLFVHQTLGLYQKLVDYLSLNITNNSVNADALAFARQLVDAAITETNQADVNNLVGLSLALQQNGNNPLEEAFMASIDQYVDISMIDPIVIRMVSAHYTAQCAILRYNHQDWSEFRIRVEASRDLLHIALDALGLIPVYGEAADLVNGALYTIEGEGVNATLSFASAIPIAGWATISTKYGLKIINVANDVNTKVRLTWTLTNNIVSFGAESTCRVQLRKILGLAVGNPLIAHHIMPISLQTEVVIQKAAKSSSAFHLNEALNGLALNSLQHSGSHANYTLVIKNKLINYDNLNPNATPLQSYNYLISLIDQIKAWVIAHPNTNINLITLP